MIEGAMMASAASNLGNIKSTKNPSLFATVANQTSVGSINLLSTQYCITRWSSNLVQGMEYCLLPQGTAYVSDYETYVCDEILGDSSKTGYNLHMGGSSSEAAPLLRGLFYHNWSKTGTGGYVRLMKLPANS